jgi:hypothetical protein
MSTLAQKLLEAEYQTSDSGIRLLQRHLGGRDVMVIKDAIKRSNLLAAVDNLDVSTSEPEFPNHGGYAEGTREYDAAVEAWMEDDDSDYAVHTAAVRQRIRVEFLQHAIAQWGLPENVLSTKL